MPCKTPLRVKLKQPFKDDKGIFVYSVPVNCGKCIYCKKQRITGWSFRLTKEAEVSNNTYFVTLTYNSENIPYCKINPDAKKRTKEGLVNKYNEEEIKDNITKVPTLCKEDVQNFIKRLREIEKDKYGKKGSKDVWLREKRKEKYDYNKPIKYYAVGEYGSKNRRCHYHIILFNIYDRESINEAWGKGEVDVKEAHINSVLYLLKYLEKESTHYKYIMALNLQPEFSLSSKRLGESYVNPSTIFYHTDNYDNNVIKLSNGVKGKIPRYLFEKIYNRKKEYDRHLEKDLEKSEMDTYIRGMYRHFKKEAEEKEEKAVKVMGNRYWVGKKRKAEEQHKHKDLKKRKDL